MYYSGTVLTSQNTIIYEDTRQGMQCKGKSALEFCTTFCSVVSQIFNYKISLVQMKYTSIKQVFHQLQKYNMLGSAEITEWYNVYSCLLIKHEYIYICIG